MGTTFANLQIKDTYEEIIKMAFPESAVLPFSNGWKAVVSADFDLDKIQNTAKNFSKTQACMVLSVEVFDDDILLLNLFQNGRKKAAYVSDSLYGYEKTTEHLDAFASAFGLSRAETGYLKTALQCGDLYKKSSFLKSCSVSRFGSTIG